MLRHDSTVESIYALGICRCGLVTDKKRTSADRIAGEIFISISCAQYTGCYVHCLRGQLGNSRHRRIVVIRPRPALRVR